MDHTANSITVLGTGPSKPTIFERPTSSGRRSTTPKLLQRSGSTLEILPNEAEAVGPTGPNKTNNHHTKSDTVKDTTPSSHSKREDNSNKIIDSNASSSSHKKVVLPSVKRDFEKHGMPNNEEFESFVRSTTPTLNKTSITDDKSTLNTLETKHGMPINKEFESFVCSTTPTLRKTSVAEDKSTLNSLETGVHGIKLESAKQAVTVTDDYYVSHRSNSSTERVDPQKEGAGHTKFNLNETDEIDSNTNSIKQMTSVSNGYYVSHSQNEVDFEPKTIVAQKASNGDADSDDSGDEIDEEGKKAPLELLSEFLETVMEKDYENAQKLCQMILIYEPDNKEAIEFKPLIDEELRKERERQLWGSSSEEGSSDEDSDDDDETEDESDSDEEDDDDEDDESDADLDLNEN